MRGHPPRPTRTDTLFPDTTPFRSKRKPGARARHPIARPACKARLGRGGAHVRRIPHALRALFRRRRTDDRPGLPGTANRRHGAMLPRSEEHTSELQSLMRISYAVFCLKKKTTQKKKNKYNTIQHTNSNTRQIA